MDSTKHLRRLGVPAGATTVILTKVRSDHDAGAFQKLFTDERVPRDDADDERLLPTKVQRPTDIRVPELEQLVEFVPVKCGVEIAYGIHFTFSYAFASAPARLLCPLQGGFICPLPIRTVQSRCYQSVRDDKVIEKSGERSDAI